MIDFLEELKLAIRADQQDYEHDRYNGICNELTFASPQDTIELESGSTLVVVDREFQGESRWSIDYRTVLRDENGEYIGIDVRVPATEMQDFDPDDVGEPFRMVAVEQTMTVYKRA